MRLNLAGAEGFEPPSPVLETGSLPVSLCPYNKKPTACRWVCISILIRFSLLRTLQGEQTRADMAIAIPPLLSARI